MYATANLLEQIATIECKSECNGRMQVRMQRPSEIVLFYSLAAASSAGGDA